MSESLLQDSASHELRLRECPRCEYALEGLPLEGTCPECGRAYEQSTIYLRVWNAGDNADVLDSRSYSTHISTALGIWFLVAYFGEYIGIIGPLRWIALPILLACGIGTAHFVRHAGKPPLQLRLNAFGLVLHKGPTLHLVQRLHRWTIGGLIACFVLGGAVVVHHLSSIWIACLEVGFFAVFFSHRFWRAYAFRRRCLEDPNGRALLEDSNSSCICLPWRDVKTFRISPGKNGAFKFAIANRSWISPIRYDVEGDCSQAFAIALGQRFTTWSRRR